MKVARIILYLLISAAVGCKSRVEAPPRPPRVPSTAMWAGGADGGSFIECDVDQKHNENRCLIYNDSTGDVEGGGFFQLLGLHRAALPNELRFRSFDGERIDLPGGQMLVAVQPLRAPGIPPTSIFATGPFVSCGEPQSAITDCSIYRPDGGLYFQGKFAFEGAQASYRDRNPKFFNLSSRTIFLVGGGMLVSK
jgi:hypothetical protein